jgi:hypothetical protein
VREVLFLAHLPTGYLLARLDQGLKRCELRCLARVGKVLGPIDTAAAGSTEQIQVTVGVPIDNERVAVRAFDPEWLFTSQNELWLRLKLALPFALEDVEGSLG